MKGLLNIYKQKGLSSSNVVVKLKKILGIKKIGHLGTLDPLAEGVLPICLGKATRLFDYFLKKQKTYIAVFTFGYETDTLDCEGSIIKINKKIPTKEELSQNIKSFIGKTFQKPPIYSSKKINGKRAYEIARFESSNNLELKPCEIEIFEYVLLKQIDSSSFEFKIVCSAGTYIRALGRDLAYDCGTFATMTSLKRVKVGDFDVSDSINLENENKESLEAKIISIENVLKIFKKINITEEMYKNLVNGKVVKTDKDNGIYSIFYNDKIVCIGEVFSNILKIKTFLAD